MTKRFRRPLPEQALLLDILEYNQKSGELHWKKWRGLTTGEKMCNTRYAGHKAGTYTNRYISVSINGVTYKAHRIIFKMMTGREVQFVDHRDLDTMNNSWSNLREATASGSSCNQRVPSTNTSGYKGVFLEPSGKYRARVMLHGRQHHFGQYINIFDANVAVMAARRELHGVYARDC